jgi:nucleotide-binding universal stress UspA family protein
MKILLALDLSAGSQVAVDEVAKRPWPAGTSVHVLGVADTERLPFAPDVVEEILARTNASIGEATDRLKTAGLTATPRVVSGDPRTMIIETAKEIEANLVVVGAQSSTGVAGFLLGSVAKSVLHIAHCSVEVARHTNRPPGQQGMRILLAVDESDFSTVAARAIAARPWPSGTEVRVMSAVDLAPSFLQAAFEPPFVDTKGMEELREQAVERAENCITEAREILSDAGLRTSEYLSVLLEDPKQAILDQAKDWDAELIVVGSHGRRGFQRFMLGSVSEAVAMHATCTVEIVREA